MLGALLGLLNALLFGELVIVSQTIPLDLPKGASASETQVVFAVSINKDGRILANKKLIENDEALKTIATEELAKNKDLRTVVQASSQTIYSVVIHVVDVLREVGITKLVFATETPPAGTSTSSKP